MVSRQDVEMGDGGLVDRLVQGTFTQEHLIHRGGLAAELHAHAARRVPLRVTVNQQRFLSRHAQRGRKVNRCGRFAYSSLTVGNTDDPTHRRLPNISKPRRKAPPLGDRYKANTPTT